jgi:uncharacterized SAM-binding protein YcdF (DUF218 family)
MLLVAPDELPHVADVAVALGGAQDRARARGDEAVRLLLEGRARYAMMAVNPGHELWRAGAGKVDKYLESQYGAEAASRILVCMRNVNSTWEESVAVRKCIEQFDWHSIVIVTSDFHTRRAKLTWTDTLARARGSYSLFVCGVESGSSDQSGWWRPTEVFTTLPTEALSLSWYLVRRQLGDFDEQEVRPLRVPQTAGWANAKEGDRR